jgi:hypothetical protein
MGNLSGETINARHAPALGVGTFSERILQIDWNAYFPFSISEQDRVEKVSSDIAFDFVANNDRAVYERDVWASPFSSGPATPEKKRYYEFSGDFFGFYRSGQIYGLFVGTPIDWSSYYFRYVAMQKQMRGLGHYQMFLSHLLNVLRLSGLERVEAHVSPSNLGNLHILNKLHFNVSGMQLSERWGAVVHLTKFLKSPNEDVFLKQFCDGVRPQVSSIGEPRKSLSGKGV